MAGNVRLIDSIAESLWANVGAYQLPEVCLTFGMNEGTGAEAFGSKKAYVRKRIAEWSKEQLNGLAIQVEEAFPTEELQILIEELVPERVPAITTITRQHLLAGFDTLGPISGKLELLSFLEKLWKLDSPQANALDEKCYSIRDEILKHMVQNDDYTHSQLFDLVGLPKKSNKRFIEFLEWTVNPQARVDSEQERYVNVINGHLKHDGLALIVSDQISGYPVYRVTKIVDGVSGTAKNLIFASNGPKPEIVFSDAINNDIKIVKYAEYCLVYDTPISKCGLLWKQLVAWWGLSKAPTDRLETERSLYQRLFESLQSPPEKLFFRTYFESFRSRLGEQLPALIPQVYLHYDPLTEKMLRGVKRVPRQRMDFLLLLSPLQRIVIEIDGVQHYAIDNQASPAKYAEMASADRELRLAGYEIFRFGGAELNEQTGKATVTDFFSRLFSKHDIRVVDDNKMSD